MWLLWLFIGFIAGVLVLLLFQLWWFLTPSRGSDNKTAVPMQFGAQFLPFRIPYDLKQLLLSPGCEEKLKKKETCICFNLFVQFLYQEFRESKGFRRWIVKRLQMEFNDLLSRSAASKLLHDIKLRNFSVGTQFPVIKDVQVTKVALAPDKDSFQDLDLVMDIDYRGGFEASVDVEALLGRRASLAVKITRLAGQARLQMTRTPYSHWTFAFLNDPIMEFKVDSEFRGRPLPQLVPLIINQFRRTVRKKHVLPAYKVRYRPFFVNPFLQPAADPADYGHIEPKGVVRVTIIKCTRLNLAALVPANRLNTGELYCQLSTSWKPSNVGRRQKEEGAPVGRSLVVGSDSISDNYVSIALRYVRHSSQDHFGLTLGKEYIPEKVNKMPVVVGVVSGSPADRAGFKIGDLIIAVNNVGITTERQAAKLLFNTHGDILVLVERKLTNIDNEDDVSEKLTTTVIENQSNPNLKVEFNAGDEFFHVSYHKDNTKSVLSDGSDNMQRSHSDVNFTVPHGSRDSNLAVDDLEASGESAPPGMDHEGDSVGVDSAMRKIQSNSILIPGAKSKDGTLDPLSVSPKSTDQKHKLDVGRMRTDSDEQDDSSNSADSPLLSRKQRIAAKATEKAAQVAQKWSTGKAVVKDIWDRRQRRKHAEDDFSNTGDVSVAISMPNSKSEEAELKFKIGDTDSISSSLLSPDIGGRPRSRSHSEPDTSSVISAVGTVDGKVLDVVDKGKEDGKSEKSESGSKATDFQQSPVGEFKKMRQLDTFNAQTKPVPSVGEPVWYQNFAVPLVGKGRYLNVIVYWKDVKASSLDSVDGAVADLESASSEGIQTKKGHTVSKTAQEQQPNGPISLGYATLFLPEILDDCSITKSLCHQQTYALRPPSVAVKLTPAVEKLMIHPGFDGRLCYGDITLGFQWLPNEHHGDIGNESNIAEEESQQPGGGKQSNKSTVEAEQSDATKRATGKKTAEAVSEYVIADGHKWLSTHFQQSIVCHVCQKKIWLKSAYKCVQCGTVSHKKCMIRVASVLGRCGQIHETLGFESTSIVIDSQFLTSGDNLIGGDGRDGLNEPDMEMAADAIEAITDAESGSVLATEGTPATAKKTTFSERFAGLRRRKPKVETAMANITAAHTAVPTSLESLNNVQWGSSEDNSPFHSLLYTKGGTYNEHMILAAKDLGKDLYTNLPVGERKAKINEQIDRLQSEIDQTTEQRLELLKQQGGKPDKGQLAAELAKLDDKLQALAILMLHYCAGLQCCLDLEDSMATEDNIQPNLATTPDAQFVNERTVGDGSDENAVGDGDSDNATFISTLTTVLKDASKQDEEQFSSSINERPSDADTMFTMDVMEEGKENMNKGQ